MAESRRKYAAGLRDLEKRALGGLDLVGEALGRALELVEQRDIELAEMVIADDDRIDGDPSNVIGLSLPLVRRMLAGLGVSIADAWP